MVTEQNFIEGAEELWDKLYRTKKMKKEDLQTIAGMIAGYHNSMLVMIADWCNRQAIQAATAQPEDQRSQIAQETAIAMFVETAKALHSMKVRKSTPEDDAEDKADAGETVSELDTGDSPSPSQLTTT